MIYHTLSSMADIEATKINTKNKSLRGCFFFGSQCIPKLFGNQQRLCYVRNPRSLMEGTETLCRDDIGDLLGSPNHL